LGAIYLNHVPKDAAKAEKWHRKAAEQGYGPGQVGLYICYKYGDGVPKNDAMADEWYRKASEQGREGFGIGRAMLEI
jgi:hypothetical protein